MKKSDVGLIGLGVMGASLALNLEDKGFSVSVYNRPHSKKDSVVKKFLDTRAKGKNFFPKSAFLERFNFEKGETLGGCTAPPGPK